MPIAPDPMPPEAQPSESPAAADAPRSLAAHHLRLFALIVDYLLVVIALKLGHQALLGQDWDLATRFGSQGTSSVTWAVALIALGLLKDVVVGRSPGKWLTGLAVVDARDPTRRAGPLRCILRNLLLPLLPLEALLVLVDRYGRRLGDRLAGTVVVAPPRVSPPARRLLVLAIGFLASLLVAFLLTGWNLRRSAAYQTAVEAASAHPEVIKVVGMPVDFGFSPELELSYPPPPARSTDSNQPSVRPAGPETARATLLLEVSGPRGEAKVRVVLDMLEAPRRWEVQTLDRVADEEAESKLIQSKAPQDSQ